MHPQKNEVHLGYGDTAKGVIFYKEVTRKALKCQPESSVSFF